MGNKKMSNQIVKFLIVSLFFLAPVLAFAANSPNVIINEIAWMGTEASYNDEWIELYNNTDFAINLEGWILKAADGSPKIKLTGKIPANGFYLLERSKDYAGALNNKGENLELYDNFGNLIDSADCGSGWPAGDNASKQTMEKNDSGWQTSQNPGGTPGAKNSVIPKPEVKSGPEIIANETPASPLDASQSESPLVADLNNKSREEETQKESVAISKKNEQISESLKSSFVFLAAATAVFSGAIILILKKKLKIEYNKNI